MKSLIKKVGDGNNINDIKISVGAKYSPNIPYLNVDYIFMFNIENLDDKKTIIDYSIAIIDTSLIDIFKPLLNNLGKLQGKLFFDKVYIIE